MATGKRYYWIKLKENFMRSDLIDHIMEQPHGAEYLLIYQMLCLKSINTEGRLELKVGTSRIPFSIDKLQRDFRWFSAKRIQEAIDVLKSLELIEIDESGTIVIQGFSELVGYETDYAVQKRIQRTGDRNIQESSADTTVENVHTEKEKDVEKEKNTYWLSEKENIINNQDYNGRTY